MIKTKKRGLLIVISSPSGCGKGTVIRSLLKKNNNLWVSISCTSREKREKEVDGVDYYFLTREEFEQKIKNNEMLEYAEYVNNYYGTPKDKVNEHLEKGLDVILEIEIQGALKIKEMYKETIFIFILPPSMEELRNRLSNRNTETKDKIDKRFKKAYTEINELSKYNYVVVNDKVESASDKINAIITSERCRVDRIEEVYLNTKEEEIHESLSNKSFINEDKTY